MQAIKYRLVLADPPWQYQNGAKVNGGATKEYPTMSTDDICALKVESVMEKDAVLILWATWPFLPDAFRVGTAWGFEYVTGFPWVKCETCSVDLWGKLDIKTQYGVGYWVIGVSEPILIFRRGKVSPPVTRFVGLIAENIRHSRKPENIYEYAESLSGPYLEMFCRRPRIGWDSFGNEIENSIKL